jgi:hypothetical protein
MKEETKLEAYMYSNKEADAAYLECVRASESANDYLDGYFLEAGDSEKKGIIATLIEKLKNLANAIGKFFTDLFSSAKAKLFKNRAEEAVKEDKELANKKIEVLDTNRIFKFTKSYVDKINKAKSVEEVDAIVNDFEKKRNTVGIFTVAVSVAGAVSGFMAKSVVHQKKAAELNRYGQELLAKKQEAARAQLKEGQKVLQGAKDLAKETGEKFNSEGLLDASAGYQAAKHRTEELQAQYDAYKSSKGYNKYVDKDMTKLERLAAKQATAITGVVSHGMNMIKGGVVGGIGKIREAIGSRAGAAKAKADEWSDNRQSKKFNKMVGMESADDDDYFFGELQMESGEMEMDSLFW